MEKTTRDRWRAKRAAAVLLSIALVSTGNFAATAAASAAPPATMSAVGLQANARTKPLGIAVEAPTLSWKSEAEGRGVVQSAYEVRVGTSSGSDDMWSTGKVMSDDQLNVVYGGSALQSQTRYYWQVRLWDGNDQQGEWSKTSWFETGLKTSDWKADWIGKSGSGEVDKWADYTADIDFDIDRLAIGTFFRAASTSNAYMWQISTADGSGIPKFRPHKRVNNTYTLLDNKPIPGITSDELLTGTHRLSVTVDGNTITTKLDNTKIDERTDASFAKGFIGFRQDYANNIDESADIKAVKVTAKNGDVLLDTDFSNGNPFNGGTITPAGLRVGNRSDVLFVSKDANKPLMRTEFNTESGKTVASARAYASAHGVYELQLNGSPVGDQKLAPGSTDYTKRIQYQTYDVTDQIKDGANAFGAELGAGWWAGKNGMWGPGTFGQDVGLIAQLRIDYTDGSHQTVKTDDSWKSHFGPYAAADNIDGEHYDANAEQNGWDRSGYDDGAWSPVVIGASDTAKLVAQPDEPVRVTQELPVQKRTDSPGVENGYIYDLGQNMVGVARMKIQGKAGDTVKIRYAEELYSDGRFYVGNLRAAKVTDYYTFKSDGVVEYTPKFTQHGFRYIEISGAVSAPAAEDVTGVVWGSDLASTGSLDTSDAMLNQLASNISWGQRGNFLSIPTDTPARDERLGWTGDINVFAPTASYLRDTRAFLQKWMGDLTDSARPNGDLPGIAPSVPGVDLGTGVGWSDSGITVPYAVWHAQGSDTIIKQNYELMKKYLELVKSGAGDDLIDTERGNWNDWLNLDDNTGTAVLSTAYYAEDARMLSEMAAAIGEDADAAAYAQLSKDVRAAFTAQLIAPDGTVQGGSQTAYAMALGMDLVTDPELRVKVGQKYIEKLAKSDNHLTTGFLGTPWLLPALSSIGRNDIAYTVLSKKDYPSWGYEIENGATTMWERWNSIKPDGSFGDEGMNSFNHYAYGAVGDWMYRNIGGISPIEPGYHSFKVAPSLGGGLTHGSGKYESVYGTIASDWKLDGGNLALDVTVPVNTTAQVVVPAQHQIAVVEGGKALSEVDGVSGIKAADGSVTFTIGSGKYKFVVDPDLATFGGVLDALKNVEDRAGELAQKGDLSAADRGHIADEIGAAKDAVQEALEAVRSDNCEAAQAGLAKGAKRVTELRSWLDESSVDGPVKRDLKTRLDAAESQFGSAMASVLKLKVVLPPATTAARPGASVDGALEIVHNGSVELTNLQATVSVVGWKADPVKLKFDKLAGGDQAQLPFTTSVPQHQNPANYPARVKFSFTTPEGTFTLNNETAWVQVDSAVQIGDVTASANLDDGQATAAVTIVNDGTSSVSGQVVLTPTGGPVAAPASERITIPAAESRVVEVPMLAGLEGISGDAPLSVSFVDRGVSLAKKDAALTIGMAAPGAMDLPGQLDHVDFGNTVSETAHAVQAAAASGTAPNEAGLTRRYANTNNPGSWFSAEYTVEAGKPFLLRTLETYDGAHTKKYNIWVDGVLVRKVEIPRSEGGQGTKAHQVLIDDPSVLQNTGKVRIKFEYPSDASGFWDPSIADSWVLPVQADTTPPLVAATVDSAVPGDNGWFRGDSSVTLSATDDRAGTPAVQFGGAQGWEDYTAPIPVTGEGQHELSYRANDVAGNSSGEQKVQVWIDSTAPVSSVKTIRGSEAANLNIASVSFSATDELSGVAAVRYRVDGGQWQLAGADAVPVVGYGSHLVEYFAADVAGNTEALRSTEIELTAPSQKFTVSFDSAGGSAVASVPNVASGSKVSRPSDPKRKGYVFAGWFVGSKAYDFSAPVTANLKLTAKWEKDNSGTTPRDKPVFKDVPKQQQFYTEIDWMHQMKYTTGFKRSDGLYYEPKQELTREAMAAFMYRLKGSPAVKLPAASPFADVKPSDKFYREIVWMYQQKLAKGTKQATGKPLYGPKQALTREAMAAFMYRFEGSPKFTAPKQSPFADMKPGSDFYTEISWMQASKLTTGFKQGSVRNYEPKRALSREAMAAFIYRLETQYRK
ncbi:family 78 glycoside hydrolase catalytic domain [Leucobacter viscericola]|uniref:alpha-L-rhamnosidase n=1 Tax=Leucobacter viscericola TaxID=2714935 RepID=A0A6G7XCY5_9MICO|nr:family 78 glycoside hydrolase catalytic domain [Leucobacter viscericola]QIK62470.1 family 78 glycoside hydrolase catalytic domain [Leucobacter viscericola]